MISPGVSSRRRFENYAGRDSKAKEIERLKGKIANVEGQIEATTERITELPKGIDAKSFYAQILKLQEHRAAFEDQLSMIQSAQVTRDEPINFADFQAFTEGLRALTENCTDPDEQAAIARKLIERIEVTPTGILIFYHVGQSHYVRELDKKAAPGAKPSAAGGGGLQSALDIKNLVDLTKPVSKPLSKYRTSSSLVACSNTLTNGRPAFPTDEKTQTHEIFSLPVDSRLGLSDTFVELYGQGQSLKDISKLTGKSKAFVRSSLVKAGVALRSHVPAPVHTGWREPGKRNVRPYFGFCYFQGKVVADPREFENLLVIHRLWTSGINPNSIAVQLNAKKIPARSAASWNRNSVVNILKRFEKELIVIKGSNYELR